MDKVEETWALYMFDRYEESEAVSLEDFYFSAYTSIDLKKLVDSLTNTEMILLISKITTYEEP